MNPIISAQQIEQIVRSHDWQYDRAGNDWRDGLIFGNGAIGAIGYAPGNLEWVINKMDVFDRRVSIGPMLTHQQVCDYVEADEKKESFFMDEAERVEDNVQLLTMTPVMLRLFYGHGDLGWSSAVYPVVRQKLSLYDGELETYADAHAVHSTVTTLAPRNTNLFVLHLSSEDSTGELHTIELSRPVHDDLDDPVWHLDTPGELSFTQEFPGGGRYAVAVKYIGSTVSMSASGKMHQKFSQNGNFDLMICVRSDYDCDNPLEEAIKEVREAAYIGFERLQHQNRSWWKDYWQKSAVQLGDETLERYYYFSLYELGCAFGKAPMPTISGICYGPLNSNVPGVIYPVYSEDQNVQIPLMPAFAVNHPELVIPFADSYLACMDEVKRHTRELFGGPGAYIPLDMCINGKEVPTKCYRYTLCGAAYSGLILVLAWRYTRDKVLMREYLYELLCEFIRFYVDNMMHEDSDGTYHLDWSIPPEIFQFTRDETATTSMLRACMVCAVEYAKEDGCYNEETAKWERILAHYPAIATRAEGGWWAGPDIPADHFTFSTHMLYPFFPSEMYVDEYGREQTQKTLIYVAQNAVERSFACKEGWHFLHDWSWMLNNMCRLRLGESEFAWEALHTFLNQYAKPNGLFIHNAVNIMDPRESEKNQKLHAEENEKLFSPGNNATANLEAKRLTAPVIEGNSVFLLFATEMLLQSFDGIVRLFPGVPKNFTGWFQNLRAQGGFLISASMERGKLSGLQITASVDGTIRLLDLWNGTFLPGGFRREEKLLVCSMMQGQSITLFTDESQG